MESVLTDPRIKDRLGKLCVGLAARCDPPEVEDQVWNLLMARLRGAKVLPFVAIVTPELQWVEGFSGYKDGDALLAVLERAERTPIPDAAPEAAMKLEALATQATRAADAAQWADVLGAGRRAGELAGRSKARAPIAAAVARARAWADGEMTRALDTVTSGGDRAAARARLRSVATTFAGEPEAHEADTGVAAIERLGTAETGTASDVEAALRRAAEAVCGTRWTALFARVPAGSVRRPVGSAWSYLP